MPTTVRLARRLKRIAEGPTEAPAAKKNVALPTLLKPIAILHAHIHGPEIRNYLRTLISAYKHDPEMKRLMDAYAVKHTRLESLYTSKGLSDAYWRIRHLLNERATAEHKS